MIKKIKIKKIKFKRKYNKVFNFKLRLNKYGEIYFPKSKK